MKDSFANRLQKAINASGLKPIEVANKTGIDKSLISHYLSGKFKPGDDNLAKLAKLFNVSEVWLHGYEVDTEGNNINNLENKSFDELELLFNKAKDKLNPSQEATIKFVMQDAIEKYEKNKESNK